MDQRFSWQVAMAYDVAGAIGATELAGTKVLKRGTTARTVKMGGAGGGLVGALVGAAGDTMLNKRGEKQKDRASGSNLPDFGKVGYLAVSEEEVVLLKVIPGGLRGRLGEVLARVSRSQIASAQFESSAMYASGITIRFVDGDQWALEAPRQSRKDAQTIVGMLDR